VGKGARIRASRSGIEVIRPTGIKVESKHKYHKSMTDPGEGKHLWTVVGCWSVIPGADGYNLDIENLLTIEGPGCYKCEQPFSQELAAKPCGGSMDLELDEWVQPGGEFGDGMK
jgi:hypothetical protein